jgi:mannitol/fructose-specific phosphotransferase system IIA component (Ntr-type)|tara:strand:- start:260 stop:391 length:132 start_codon:yes stop_codon:yes gene_type:complete
MKNFIIKGEFEFEIEANTEEEALDMVASNLEDLNNITYEVKET